MNGHSFVYLGMGMSFESLLIELLKVSFPKGELKMEMFRVHNALVGQSAYITKHENVNTMCGSCIMRVKSNLFKYYHHEHTPKYESLIFQDKFVLDKRPVYGIKKSKG